MKIIGISVRTTNQNGQAMQDIGNLWQRFFSEQLLAKIPNKVSDAIYSIYTNYQKDYTEPYTCIIGVEVTTLSTIPDGLEGREFPEQTFEKFVAKGAMPQAVGAMWQHIWDNDATLNRTYIYDYECYTEKSQQGDTSEVDIFIGVRENK